MTETHHNMTPMTAAGLASGIADSAGVHRWLPLAAIVCSLLSTGLRAADEPKVDPAVTGAAAVEATNQATDPATTETTAATQSSDPAAAATQTSEPAAATQPNTPAAATEPPSRAKAETPNPYADFKPPEMPEPAPFSTQKLDPELVKALKERWGVELLGIRQSGAGMFLDFRFKVLDIEKSLPLFDHRVKPYVVAHKSEIKLPVPMAAKVGAFRPTNRGKNIKADKTYYMLFANPDRHVKPGEKVSVVIGDFRAEHLTVQ